MRAIRDRLRELYGRPVNHPHGHPIAELVRTVLSQNTNDRNRDVAYERLRAALPTWDEVRDAPVERGRGGDPARRARADEGAADPGGAARAAGGGGEPTLDWLADADRDEAIEFLVGLPGVGRKTAACVMIFALGRPEIPVDTHVYRVGGRLGLFPAGPRSSAPTTRCSRSPTPTTPTSCTST